MQTHPRVLGQVESASHLYVVSELSKPVCLMQKGYSRNSQIVNSDFAFMLGQWSH